MMDYHFTLAGLQLLLRMPFEIEISENLRPFLCQPQHQIDCCIQLQSCDPLPPMTDGGLWHGFEYHDKFEGTSRIFHCTEPKDAAFAVTQFFENGNIEILVLPDHLSYFTGSIGLFNRIGLETLLLQQNGLLLHASLIKHAGKAIAFAGPSGVGKSTQAQIWQQHLQAQILNGDRAILRHCADGWMAYGAPYAGTSGIYKNDSAPLAAIILLQQAAENNLRPLTQMEAFSHLYPEFSIHRWEKDFVAKATDLCLQLLAQTPVYQLACWPDENAALLVKKGLNL